MRRCLQKYQKKTHLVHFKLFQNLKADCWKEEVVAGAGAEESIRRQSSRQQATAAALEAQLVAVRAEEDAPHRYYWKAPSMASPCPSLSPSLS